MTSPATYQVGVSDTETSILKRVRMELGDIPFPFAIEIVGDGERRHFRTEHRPIDLRTVQVLQTHTVDPGVPDPDHVLSDKVYSTGAFGSDFSISFDPVTIHTPEFQIDADAGVIYFQVAPDNGTIYELSGTKWRYFTDDDLMTFVGTSVSFNTKSLTSPSGGPMGADDIPSMYEYPIALYAVIQALWALVTDAAFDIDILAPDGVNIPRSERFRQLLEVIGARQTQYDEIAAALNIGLSAIEVFTVRRTAKLTNRLVPIFLPMEVDDGSKPKRVLQPQFMLGTTPVETHVGGYDIDCYSGYPYSVILDFNRNLTGYIPEASIRKAKGAPYGAPLTKFNFDILDAPAGIIMMYLTAQQTARLPYNAYWEFQLRWANDPSWPPVPFLAGLIRASISEVTR